MDLQPPDQKLSTTTKKRTQVLCHACLTPHPYPLPFSCNHSLKAQLDSEQARHEESGCGGMMKYCSQTCQLQDWQPVRMGGGGHVSYCHFLGRHCASLEGEDGVKGDSIVGKVTSDELASYDTTWNRGESSKPLRRRRGRIVQIACSDIEFPVYQPPPISECKHADLVEIEPTGQAIKCQVGDQAEVVFLPHQIDAGGSLLLRLTNCLPLEQSRNNHYEHEHEENEPKEREGMYILCDAWALEPASPLTPLEPSPQLLVKSEQIWLQGVHNWFQSIHNSSIHAKKDGAAKEMMQALDLFQKSLQLFSWQDREGDEGVEEWIRCGRCGNNRGFDPRNAFDASPFRRADTRIALSKRCHFVGICLHDYNQPKMARKYLIRAIQTLLPFFPEHHDDINENDYNHDQDRDAQSELEQEEIWRRHALFTELMLSFEEQSSNMQAARMVAQWAMERNLGGGLWTDIYQRPGFVSTRLALDAEVKLNQRCGFEKEAAAVIDKGHPWYPKWCHELEKNANVIRQELLALWKDPSITMKHNQSPTTNTTANMPPKHWPRVGDTAHRASGHSDHRVVSKLGEWREFVLFGSGGVTPHAQYAPKTKLLLERFASDAVSLCLSGGGEIIFSLLAPGTKIAPHCASNNLRLTAHLGLVIPNADNDKRQFEEEEEEEKCAIGIAGQRYTWKPNQCLVFDDSYEHQVVNTTKQCRAVLLLRFWHPSIPPRERQAAMEEVLKQKQWTERKRYVPPLPKRFEMVERWGLKEQRCGLCGRKGEILVREDGMQIRRGADSADDVAFTCYCGRVHVQDMSVG